MITAGKDDSLFKSYVSEWTTKLFDKMGGFNVDPHEFLGKYSKLEKNYYMKNVINNVYKK